MKSSITAVSNKYMYLSSGCLIAFLIIYVDHFYFRLLLYLYRITKSHELYVLGSDNIRIALTSRCRKNMSSIIFEDQLLFILL